MKRWGIPTELVPETYLFSPYSDRPLTDEEFSKMWPLMYMDFPTINKNENK